MFAFGPFGGSQPLTSEAQISDYQHDILPGLHDGLNPISLRLTTGWRTNSYLMTTAIDVVPDGQPADGRQVSASFRTTAPDLDVKARVRQIIASGDGCRKQVIRFY